MTLRVTQAAGSVPGVLLFGLGQGALPISPGCTLSIAPLVPTLLLPLTTSPSGTWSITAPLLFGLPPATVAMQAVIAGPTGIAASNAVQMTIG